MKSFRQEKILEIITTQEIETQNQLIDALAKEGLSSTQATLSRDIRELRLVKELGPNGKHKYVSPAEGGVMNYAERLRTIFRESVTSLACAQNIVVIKTLPGMASAACSAIDSMAIRTIVGSLAGDDTAFLAMTDSQAAEVFCAEIKTMLR
ncbi:MAG: arginine repressor [Oscillospiraceae bacterium]|nr:arginine repressor [Oscillospiraceae bacterium]